jgi:hypothetical protein
MLLPVTKTESGRRAEEFVARNIPCPYCEKELVRLPEATPSMTWRASVVSFARR